MKTIATPRLLALAGLAFCSMGGHAQDMARVLSSVPVMQAVNVPQQNCAQTPVVVAQPNSGAGALMGAIAGGAVGNALGHGAGQPAATALGLMGGAIMGDHIEGPNTTVQDVTTCTTQMSSQTRIAYYNVTYEYAGKQYTVQMPYDPGPHLQIQVMPAGQAAAAMPPAGAVAPVTTGPATVVAPAPVYVAPPPYYAYPYAYPYGYPPVSVHFGFGYYRGYGRRW